MAAMMSSCCSDSKPCAIPRDPSVVLTHHEGLAQQDGTTNGHAQHPNEIPTGHKLGLNDGVIFPESHFTSPPSEMQMVNAALDRAPLRGALNVCIVLVDFSDKPFSSGPQIVDRFNKLFFSTGQIPTGSVTEYYKDVSGGNISLKGKIVGPYRMPHKLTDYAGTNRPDGNSGLQGSTPNGRTLADDALKQAKSHLNFAEFDNDNNGFVDAFIVVHSGTGAEQSSTPKNFIWSHKWVLPQEVTQNGKKVYGYLTIPEDSKIGVCAHELGHLLFGWPDLYDTDYSSKGIGSWCLMSFGSWGGGGDRPVHPSAWCKVNQGWVNLTVEKQNHSITLGAVETKRDVRRLWKGGDVNSKEYFLIENRQSIGYDQSIPAAGLLVWHIDDNTANNTNEAHRKVDLIQADGLKQLNTANSFGDAGDPYPGTKHNTSFTPQSNPNSKGYNNVDSKVAITNISASGASMTMNVSVA